MNCHNKLIAESSEHSHFMLGVGQLLGEEDFIWPKLTNLKIVEFQDSVKSRKTRLFGHGTGFHF